MTTQKQKESGDETPVASKAEDASPQKERNPLSTVGYTALELLSRACGNPRGWRAGQVRWAAVGDVFHVGSTTAIALCDALQIDPHEKNKSIEE